MIYLASFVVVALAVAAMSFGVLLGRRSIEGSCGGVAGECPHCTVECRRMKHSS